MRIDITVYTTAYFFVLLLGGETFFLNACHVKNIGVGKSFFERGKIVLAYPVIGHVLDDMVGHTKAGRAHVTKFNVVQCQ